MDKDKQKNLKKDSKAFTVFGFTVLLLFYIATNILLPFVSRDSGYIAVFGNQMPIASFAGVLSSLGNICLIFMVVMYGKAGFIVALVILLGQFPMVFLQIVRLHMVGSIPGLFNNLFTIIAIILIYTRNKKILKYQDAVIENLQEKQKLSRRLFEQTATALVNSIDAKDTYSHGHSLRVAEYSERIARAMGKDEEEVSQIYYAALLHDVGKIGIDDRIINKNGKLTPEEYEVIKSHPVMGNQILSSISEYPYLSIGAHYHHERYDGKGYPDGLKGEDIPEIARIISVADAYDAMTSTRSYREALPQPKVREEIVKGAGSQFDPKIARTMQRIIDSDLEYRLRERRTIKEFAGKSDLECEEFKSAYSNSMILLPFKYMLKLKVSAIKKKGRGGALLLFDSSDGRVHTTEQAIRDMDYFEYAIIWLDGTIENKKTRKIETEKKESRKTDLKAGEYYIEAYKCRDHVFISIDDGSKTTEVIMAMPDSSHFVYGALTGEYCTIGDTQFDKSETRIPADNIKRIAPEISYIAGKQGDLPNVQIDTYRTDATEGVEVKDGMEFSFHSMSLPTAKLIWHCPYIVLFYSKDKKIKGEDYKEYALIRFDGEYWDEAEDAKNTLLMKDDGFIGWNEWKEENKRGIDCKVSFERNGDIIVIKTDNLGLELRNTTMLPDDCGPVYAAITGDQVAITDIHIKK